MMAETRFELAVIVDDDPDIALAARLALRNLFAEIVVLDDPEALPAMLATRQPDVVLLDLNFERGATDGARGLALLGRIMTAEPDLAVVIITAHGGVAVAVEAIKRGATDFVSKPWSNERLASTVRTAVALRQSRREAQTERRRNVELTSPSAETPLLGQSAAMRRVQSLIARAAPTEANVLILGENGTGKELVARELHRQSRRVAAPMVSVDLGAISDTLFDAELFGHAKGAFTDAREERIGRLQAANGSTLFLDEVGNLPLHLQPKLLTALEQRLVTPVGSNRAVPIDVRVVAATNLSADRLADEARFRQDLLFRLNTVEIEIPPLRSRREDIPALLDHFLRLYARKYRKPERLPNAATLAALIDYGWPGNVRALRHAAERAVILAEGNTLALDDFPFPRPAGGDQPAPMAVPASDLNLDRQERQIVEQALRKHHFNISLAAGELGLSRAALYRRMEKHGL
ncbi:sigma-54 dependent transcriptional regulator [Sphingosinicellaceae bacterium]|nr:sigma-54 dependent transcriptional regulator [Sphingosinicellaceae bacterium]